MKSSGEMQARVSTKTGVARMHRTEDAAIRAFNRTKYPGWDLPNDPDESSKYVKGTGLDSDEPFPFRVVNLCAGEGQNSKRDCKLLIVADIRNREAECLIF